MLSSIEKFPISEVNEYGTKFVDWEDLPMADPHDFLIKGPHQYTITGSWGYGKYDPNRKMYTVATKQHFPSKIFVEDGVPFMTEIGCYAPNSVIFVRGERGYDKYCSSFEEALDWAARYLQAKTNGIVVYDCLKYLSQ